ncbi:hypothetical protein BJ944DRAFT_251533 [Cunninghamella echinulata]|nr:hypothetical protein BJ944DRAFT_251533 [Cunninghamella echinulata]
MNRSTNNRDRFGVAPSIQNSTPKPPSTPFGPIDSKNSILLVAMLLYFIMFVTSIPVPTATIFNHYGSTSNLEKRIIAQAGCVYAADSSRTPYCTSN